MANESFGLGAFTSFFIEPGTTAKGGSSGYTFDANSERYDFLQEDVARHRSIIGGHEIRGTRVAHQIRTRFAHDEFYGDIVKYISPSEMNKLIPKFHGDEADDIFDSDEDIPYFSMLFYRDAGIFGTPATSNFEYWDAKIDKFILRGRANAFQESGEPSLVLATLKVIACGQTELAVPSGFPTTPALADDATMEPYVFHDTSGYVTLAGVARPIEEFILYYDNDIEAKYVNAVNPYALRPRNRIIRLRLKLPWNDDTDDLYDQAKEGAAATLRLENGSYYTEFQFGTLQVEDVTPTASGGKSQLAFILDCTARRNASNAYDVRIINDITASPSPSQSPSQSPSPSPSVSPSESPSLSPSASESPSVSPSLSPSASLSPSLSPSESPSESPSLSPSASLSPSESPSASPSASPTGLPSESPSASPSLSPSASLSPSESPSASLSESPSESPSASPSESPSASPSLSPSASMSPTGSASESPSASPSESPSVSPSKSPSSSPSKSPSQSASRSPSPSPSVSPSASSSPSHSPSESPSVSPTGSASESPTPGP